jgi:hypothetical protein
MASFYAVLFCTAVTSTLWDWWPSGTNCLKGDAGRRDVSDKCSSRAVGWEGGGVE